MIQASCDRLTNPFGRNTTVNQEQQSPVKTLPVPQKNVSLQNNCHPESSQKRSNQSTQCCFTEITISAAAHAFCQKQPQLLPLPCPCPALPCTAQHSTAQTTQDQFRHHHMAQQRRRAARQRARCSIHRNGCQKPDNFLVRSSCLGPYRTKLAAILHNSGPKVDVIRRLTGC